MKAQYFGDVNDYRKFALLRLVAEVGGFRIGVCWMLTEPDDSGQGAKREYLKRPEEWQAFDPVVFNLLAVVPERPSLADLKRIESENLIPRATYFEALTPDKKEDRAEWHRRCLEAFAGVDLAFFDPDNGLGIAARPRGRKHSNKYVRGGDKPCHGSGAFCDRGGVKSGQW